MIRFVACYGAIAAVMLALDALWLGLIAQSFYRDAIGHLMADVPSLAAAAAFYVVYPLGVLLFAVAPPVWTGPGAAPHKVPWLRAAGAGALFGFFAYATYDLSNLSTLREWPWRLALVDIAWGTTLTAAAAAAGRWAWVRRS